jgi:hypothetical protein
MPLDDYYLNLIKKIDELDQNSEEYKRTHLRIQILATLVQNDDIWYSVKDFIELLKLPTEGIEGEKWRKYIGNFLYRMYKRGFLERKLYIDGKGTGYEYRAKTSRVKNQEIFFYFSYSELQKGDDEPDEEIYIEI